MDWSSLLQGITQGFTQRLNRTRKAGKGLFDRLMGGGENKSDKGYERLRPSEDTEYPFTTATGNAYLEGEDVPIPQVPRTRAMEPLGMSDLLRGGGFTSNEESDLIRQKEDILRRLLRGEDLSRLQRGRFQ